MCLVYTDGNLCALIKARQSSREQKMDSFFDTLEQKYANGSGRTSSKKGSSSTKSGTSSSSGRAGKKAGKGKSRRKN